MCIAEVEELVEAGEIKPEEIHLPGIFVHRIVKSEKVSHFIAKLTVTKKASTETEADAAKKTDAKPGKVFLFLH